MFARRRRFGKRRCAWPFAARLRQGFGGSLSLTREREAGRVGRAEVVSGCVRLISFELRRTRVERAPSRPLLASTVAGGVSLLEAAKAGGVCRLLRRRRRPRRLQPRRLQARFDTTPHARPRPSHSKGSELFETLPCESEGSVLAMQVGRIDFLEKMESCCDAHTWLRAGVGLARGLSSHLLVASCFPAPFGPSPRRSAATSARRRGGDRGVGVPGGSSSGKGTAVTPTPNPAPQRGRGVGNHATSVCALSPAR